MLDPFLYKVSLSSVFIYVTSVTIRSGQKLKVLKSTIMGGFMQTIMRQIEWISSFEDTVTHFFNTVLDKNNYLPRTCQMIEVHSMLRALLAIYHLVSNSRWCRNCLTLPIPGLFFLRLLGPPPSIKTTKMRLEGGLVRAKMFPLRPVTRSDDII